MAKINILPPHVAELIAAGEVVERPSSAVKELIENAVDAGADRITVEIKSGGVRYIRISDNGCGIARDDIRAAFISHATSKIKTGEDLEKIMTLGFRGEALASIAAVARVEVLTKTADEDAGTRYIIEGGKEKLCEDAGCPNGTTFIIRDIFYNTPARMKFLKKDATEGNYVSDAVMKLALANPKVAFKLIKDNKQTLATSGDGELKNDIFSVLGGEFASNLLPCRYEIGGISVSGFVSRPEAGRATRSMQFCFVNGRYVRIPVAATALDNAYKNSVMIGRFPSCVLFVTIPPDTVDVNVHPAKTEVRFSDERKIYEVVYYAASGALREMHGRPQMSLNQKEPINEFINRDKTPIRQTVMAQAVFEVKAKAEERESIPIPEPAPEAKSFTSHVNINITVDDDNTENTQKQFSGLKPPAISEDNVSFKVIEARDSLTEGSLKTEDTESALISSPKISGDNAVFGVIKETGSLRDTSTPDYSVQQSDIPSLIPDIKASAPEKSDDYDDKGDSAAEPENFTVLGEAFNTYIIAQTEKKLLFIDKHAAHERMIFNELKKRGADKSSQLLLSPVTVTLSRREYIAVTDNLELFRRAGYDAEDFGEGCVVVRSCPIDLTDADIADIVTQLAGELVKGSDSMMPEKLDWLYHSTACRAAIKTGNDISFAEKQSLVRRVLSDPEVRYCPHGRPVIIEMSQYELEKQFGRIT